MLWCWHGAQCMRAALTRHPHTCAATRVYVRAPTCEASEASWTACARPLPRTSLALISCAV